MAVGNIFISGVLGMGLMLTSLATAEFLVGSNDPYYHTQVLCERRASLTLMGKVVGLTQM